MRRLIIISIIVAMASCHSKKCRLIYYNTENEFCVETNNQNDSIEQGRYTYYNSLVPEKFVSVGFFKNGFRNLEWAYNINDKIKQINWAYVNDTSLGIETNVIVNPDSIRHADHTKKINYSSPYGPFSLTYSVNGPLKDSNPMVNYENIIRKEFEQFDYLILNYKTRKINGAEDTIYIADLTVQNRKDTSEKVFLRTAYAFFSGSFIEITVNWQGQDNPYGPLFFEGLLTNFYYKKHRLFYPFRRT